MYALVDSFYEITSLSKEEAIFDLNVVKETLTPLIEGELGLGLGHWTKGQLSRAPSVSYKRSDLRLFLGIMVTPLASIHVCATDPLPHLSIKDTPIVDRSCLGNQGEAGNGGVLRDHHGKWIKASMVILEIWATFM
ncbi:hypothetical protein E2542_SST26820 [Spatholobus suberectus]|nr:hypothetical protein E2542_SST26820 [Spatholobus suberectus]